MEIKTCLGCGIKLQYEDDNKEGYILKRKYDEGALYCQRCFKLKNYNEVINDEVSLSEDDIITKVNQGNSHVFFLIDFLNIGSSTINTFKKIKVNKTLIISKSDLIIKGLNTNNIINNIKNIYDIDSDIIYLSSKNNENVNSIFKIMDKNNKKSCYILGYTNSGKSTLINKLLDSETTTTSYYTNTTLDFNELDINGYKIIDSPGFNLNNTFYENSEKNLMKRMNPKYFVNPITYQTKDNQIFLLEDRLYLKGFDNNSITFYISNLIKIKKIYKDETIKYKTIDVDNNSDIVISTLGFINVKKSCKLLVNEDLYDLVEVRKSILSKS